MSTRAFRRLGLMSTVTLFAAQVSAQTLLAPKPSAIQHVTASTSAVLSPSPATTSATTSATTARTRPGKSAAQTIALQVDVSPKGNIHVYAPGARDFSAVSLVLTPHPGVIAGTPIYPAADPASPGGDETPAYRRAFRITQPITVKGVSERGADDGGNLVLSGVLNYQACDDRLCYPVASLPVSWTIHAR